GYEGSGPRPAQSRHRPGRGGRGRVPPGDARARCLPQSAPARFVLSVPHLGRSAGGKEGPAGVAPGERAILPDRVEPHHLPEGGSPVSLSNGNFMPENGIRHFLKDKTILVTGG